MKIQKESKNELLQQFVDTIIETTHLSKREIVEECIYKYGIELLARAKRGTDNIETILVIPMNNDILTELDYYRDRKPKSKYIEEALREKFQSEKLDRLMFEDEEEIVL